ncbi:hypothetical protein LDENG_00128340 [Lucifuga dentata]|nr:hypothetical protein LDENG_00128340 [Lucifuga dentata]
MPDTSEVMLGPFLGEPMASQLDDTLPMTDLILQVGEDDLIVTSFTPPQANTTVTTQDLASAGDEVNSASASYDILCITIKLHRVNLLDEIICQFKDPTLLKHPLKYPYINEKGADGRCILGGIGTTQLKGKSSEFHHCLQNGRKKSGNPLAEY